MALDLVVGDPLDRESLLERKADRAEAERARLVAARTLRRNRTVLVVGASAVERHLEEHLVARVGIEPELAAAGVRALQQLRRIDAVHHVAISVHTARGITITAQRRIAAHDVGAGIEPGLAAGRRMDALDDLPRGQLSGLDLNRHQGQQRHGAHHHAATRIRLITTIFRHVLPPWVVDPFQQATPGADTRSLTGSIRRISTATVNADTMCMNDTITNTGV